MAHSDPFDMPAFKAHLDVIYHDRLTDIPPEGLNLYSLSRNLVSPQPKNSDAAGHAAPTDAGGATDRPAASSPKDKLSQEASMSDPEQMRRIFPSQRSDTQVASSNSGDQQYLNMGAIWSTVT
jgi:hypothetical protein